jgi:hypothetical protein
VKIPFTRTISGAYNFAFANIFSLLGIGWLPFLLLGAVIAGVVYELAPQVMAIIDLTGGKPDPAKVLALVPQILLGEAIVIPVLLLASAMVTVGVMRKAFGQMPGPVYVYFSLDTPVWRLIGAYLLLWLLAVGTLIVLVGGVALVWFALDKVAPAAAIAVTVLLGIAAWVWAIYAIVRVQFFLPAVVVAENHISLGRSWALGRGNFWRIVGVVLVMTIPVGMAMQILEQTILQTALGTGTFYLPPNPTPEQTQQFLSSIFGALKMLWPYLAVLQLVYAILVTGLIAGAVANAYNLVTGGSDIAPPKASA